VRRRGRRELDGPVAAWAPQVVSVQRGLSGDPLEVGSDGDRFLVVHWPRYVGRLNSPHVPNDPQANVFGIGVFFLVEPEPSLELEFVARDADFAGEAHKLQFAD
jgi:hypothetical protein